MTKESFYGKRIYGDVPEVAAGVVEGQFDRFYQSMGDLISNVYRESLRNTEVRLRSDGEWVENHVYKVGHMSEVLRRDGRAASMFTDITLSEGSRLQAVIPYGFVERELDGGVRSLVMSYLSDDGELREIDVSMLPGMEVVESDGLSPYEVEGELLVEINYINSGNQAREGKRSKPKKRRLRVLDIAYGVHSNYDENGKAEGSHRALGEFMDYYLIAQDTQYDPNNEEASYGIRQFPFWRIWELRGKVPQLNAQKWFADVKDTRTSVKTFIE